MHGFPDYGAAKGRASLYAEPDLMELAARLSGITPFDRAGKLIGSDGFECGLNGWSSDALGADQTIEYSPGHKRTGAGSARLYVADAGGSSVTMIRGFSIPVYNQAGFEWTFRDLGAEGFIRFRYRVYHDGILYHAEIDYNSNSSTLSYLNSAGVLVVLATELWLGSSVERWYTFKLIVDLVENNYVRLKNGPVVYDLAGIPLYNYASGYNDIVEVLITCWNGVGGTAEYFIDDVLFTVDEP